MKTFSKAPGIDEESRMVICPVCRGEEFASHWSVEGADFVRCRGCGLILQNPQPVRGALAARYDREYFEYEIENEEGFYRLMRLGLDDVGFFEEIVPTLPEPLSLLDVGCATGRLLHHFRSSGWGTAGAELCRESAEYGNRRYGVGIRAMTLHDAAFPSESFSAVHASHLIEHLDDPSAFAAEVHRVLKPGGIFICVTPSSDGLQARLFRARWRSAIADHVTLFDRRTLRRLLGDAGFTVERVRTWGGLAAGAGPAWLKGPMDRLAKRWGFGDVVLMAARRGS